MGKHLGVLQGHARLLSRLGAVQAAPGGRRENECHAALLLLARSLQAALQLVRNQMFRFAAAGYHTKSFRTSHITLLSCLPSHNLSLLPPIFAVLVAWESIPPHVAFSPTQPLILALPRTWRTQTPPATPSSHQQTHRCVLTLYWLRKPGLTFVLGSCGVSVLAVSAGLNPVKGPSMPP